MATELSAPSPTVPVPARPAAPPLVADLPLLTPLVARARAQPRLAVIVGGAALAAAIVAAMLWGRSPDYKVLYANVPDRDGGAIIASLQQMNVPYRFSEGGSAILVPADKASELRLKLAAQGLPKSATAGFELLDNQKFGTSQFAEQVNYQRGLEGELARSIETIAAVQSARVHLALPKPSLFVRDQRKPTASVVLALHPGRSVDEGQVSAIVHLVSSSVPELDARSVTVVDQHGTLLSAAHDGARALDTAQLKYVDSIEQGYVRRIEAILQPLLGVGNVRAQVAAEVDFTVVEGTEEKYRPNQEAGASAVRSQQSTESSQQGGAAASGVPGALSNQPPANATAPLGAASGAKSLAAGARTPSSNSRRDVTTNYEVDRSIRHTQQGAGATRRLSVAVVVNNREVRGADGKTQSAPLAPAELDQVRDLVKEAMGFNAARGDSLNVVNRPFTVEAVPQVQVPFWKDRENIDLAKAAAQYLLGAVAAVVVLVAVLRRRPAAHVTTSATPLAAPEGAPETGLPGHLPPPKNERELALERAHTRRRADIEYAQQTASDDPQLVASLVRHWMST